MPLQFRATERDELDSVIAFLVTVLQGGASTPGFEAEHVAWKYYDPRADWEGSRSFVLEDAGRIVAHLAVMPGCLATESGAMRSMHFIDWAAAPDSFIAGSSLLRKLMRRFEVTFCIGGSPDNQRALPILGFKPVQATELWARPIRPWLQTRTHQYRNWKLPARFGRNLFYSLAPARDAGAWRAVEIQPKEVPQDLWSAGGGAAGARIRQAETYEYFLRSPRVPFGFYLMLENDTPRGCLCMTFPPGQARIGDIWLANASVDELTGALAAAQRAALEKEEAAEILIRTSTPALREAARRSGFRFCQQIDLMAWSAAKLQIPIEAPLIVDDACFLHGHHPQYLT